MQVFLLHQKVKVKQPYKKRKQAQSSLPLAMGHSSFHLMNLQQMPTQILTVFTEVSTVIEITLTGLPPRGSNGSWLEGQEKRD